MAKKKFNYKESVQEIDEILNMIEENELDIDELSEKVKRVSLLIKECKLTLKSTQKEVEDILESMDSEEN
ncbi:MAG: exodeoxyribonuclease VII small subunit [Mangrovibacterium sp.]